MSLVVPASYFAPCASSGGASHFAGRPDNIMSSSKVMAFGGVTSPLPAGIDAFDAFVQAANPQHPEHSAWREKYASSTRSMRKSLDESESIASHRRHRATSRPSSTRSPKPRQSMDAASVRGSPAVADVAPKPASVHSVQAAEQRAQSPLAKKAAAKKSATSASDAEKRRRRKTKRDKGKQKLSAPPIPPPRISSHAASLDVGQDFSYAQNVEAGMSTSSLSQAHSVASSYKQPRGVVSPYNATHPAFLEPSHSSMGYLPQRGLPMQHASSSISLQPAASRASMSAVRQSVFVAPPITSRRSIDFRFPEESPAKLRQERSSPSTRRGFETLISPLRQAVSVTAKRSSADRHLPVSSDVVEPMPILRPSLDLRSPVRSAGAFATTATHSSRDFGRIDEAAELADGSAGIAMDAVRAAPLHVPRRQRAVSQVEAGRLAAKATITRATQPLPSEAPAQAPSVPRASIDATRSVRRKSRRRSTESNTSSRAAARAAATNFTSPFVASTATDGTPMLQDSSASDDGVQLAKSPQRAPLSLAIPAKTAPVAVLDLEAVPLSPSTSTPTRSRTKVHRKAVPSHLLSDPEGLIGSDSVGSMKQEQITPATQDSQQQSADSADYPASASFLKPLIYSHVPDAPALLADHEQQAVAKQKDGDNVTPNLNEQTQRASHRHLSSCPPMIHTQSDSNISRKSMDHTAHLEQILRESSAEKSGGGMFARFRRSRASSRVSMSKSRVIGLPTTQQTSADVSSTEQSRGSVVASQSADAGLGAAKRVGLGIETPNDLSTSLATPEPRTSTTDSKWRRRLTSFSSNKSLRTLAQAQAQKELPPMPADRATILARANEVLRAPQTPEKLSTPSTGLKRDNGSTDMFATASETIHKSLSPALVRDATPHHESDTMFGSNDTELAFPSFHTPTSQRAASSSTASEDAPVLGKRTQTHIPSLHSSRRSSANEVERARTAQGLQPSPSPSAHAEDSRKRSFDMRRPRLRSKSVSRTSPALLERERAFDKLDFKPRSSFAADRDRSAVLHQLGYIDGVQPAMPSRASTASSTMRKLFGQKERDVTPSQGIYGADTRQASASRASLSLSRMASNVFGSDIAIGNARRPSVHIVTSDQLDSHSPTEPAPSSSVGCELTPSLTERTDPDTSTLAESTSGGHRKPSTVAESFVMMNSASSLLLHDGDVTDSANKTAMFASDHSTADDTPPGSRASVTADLDAFAKMLRDSAEQDAARVKRIAAAAASSPCLVSAEH